MSRLFLGNLPFDIRDRDLEDLFRNHGRILEITTKHGFGFIELSSRRDASDAVHDLHGTRFMGERLVVEYARAQRQREVHRRTNHRLIIENLSHGVHWQDVKDLMRKAGDVAYADIGRDGQGVVEFHSASDLHHALKTLDGEYVQGKPVSLREYDPSRDRAWASSQTYDRERDYHWNNSRDDSHDRRDRDREHVRDHDRDRERGRDRHEESRHDRHEESRHDRHDRHERHERRRSHSHSRPRSSSRGSRSSERRFGREREKEKKSDRYRSRSPVDRRGRSDSMETD